MLRACSHKQVFATFNYLGVTVGRGLVSNNSGCSLNVASLEGLQGVGVSNVSTAIIKHVSIDGTFQGVLFPYVRK